MRWENWARTVLSLHFRKDLAYRGRFSLQIKKTPSLIAEPSGAMAASFTALLMVSTCGVFYSKTVYLSKVVNKTLNEYPTLAAGKLHAQAEANLVSLDGKCKGFHSYREGFGDTDGVSAACFLQIWYFISLWLLRTLRMFFSVIAIVGLFVSCFTYHAFFCCYPDAILQVDVQGVNEGTLCPGNATSASAQTPQQEVWLR
jgi:hypothetical protein